MPDVSPQGVMRHSDDFGFPVTVMTQAVDFASGWTELPMRRRVHERSAEMPAGN